MALVEGSCSSPEIVLIESHSRQTWVIFILVDIPPVPPQIGQRQQDSDEQDEALIRVLLAAKEACSAMRAGGVPVVNLVRGSTQRAEDA